MAREWMDGRKEAATAQCVSGTNHWELVQTPPVPSQTTRPSETRHKPGESTGPLHFWPAGCKCGASRQPPRFSSSPAWLMKLRKAWYLGLESFITKDTDQEPPTKRHMGWGLGVPYAEFLCPLPVESGRLTLSGQPRVHLAGSSTGHHCPEFYWGFTTEAWYFFIFYWDMINV